MAQKAIFFWWNTVMKMLRTCKRITVSEEKNRVDRQTQTRKEQRCLRNGKPPWWEETKLVLSSVSFCSGQTEWAKKHFAKRHGGYGSVAITVSKHILLIPWILPWGDKETFFPFHPTAGLVRCDSKLSFSRYVFGKGQWLLETKVHNKRETQF